MTEKELEIEVLAIAKGLRLMVRRVPDSRRITHVELGRGFPDLEILGPHRLMFAELKTEGGQLSRDEKRWRYALEAAGQRYVVWRPQHLRHRDIEAELRLMAS